jgi:hypothetical protein
VRFEERDCCPMEVADDGLEHRCDDYFRVSDDTPGTKIVIAEAEQAIGDNHRLHGRRLGLSRKQTMIVSRYEEIMVPRNTSEP